MGVNIEHHTKHTHEYSLFFCFGYAATQLACQLQQEHTQEVFSNKVARQHPGLVRRHSRNGP